MNIKDNENWTSDKVSWWCETVKGNLWEKIPYRLDIFSDFDLEKAQEYFKNNIQAILLDIDDCVAPAYEEILEKNYEKIKELRSKNIQIEIVSNWINIQERCKKILELWVTISKNNFSKPSVKSYLESCENIQIKPEYTIMIWDDISKDGWSLQTDDHGNNILLWYIPVKPIWNSYQNIPWFWKKINYFFKKISRTIANSRNGL